MEKRLTQTSVWIRFDYALLDPSGWSVEIKHFHVPNDHFQHGENFIQCLIGPILHILFPQVHITRRALLEQWTHSGHLELLYRHPCSVCCLLDNQLPSGLHWRLAGSTPSIAPLAISSKSKSIKIKIIYFPSTDMIHTFYYKYRIRTIQWYRVHRMSESVCLMWSKM